MTLKKSDKIFVAGHRGMVGSALIRRLEAQDFTNLLTRDRSQLDLSDEFVVANFFDEARPDIVILAAAKVGGIKANNDFPV
jgi:GDP-L-fucose synthase